MLRILSVYIVSKILRSFAKNENETKNSLLTINPTMCIFAPSPQADGNGQCHVEQSEHYCLGA